MQYLYCGGAESLLIKNNEIMEVRNIYLHCTLGAMLRVICVPFTPGHVAIVQDVSTPVRASSASPAVPRRSLVLGRQSPSLPVTHYGNQRRKSRKIKFAK